jgi:SAM-dependent methyltransferase
MADAGTRPCIACGSDRPHDLVYEKWGHPIFRCRTCGLGSTPPPGGFDPRTLYDEGYFRGARRDGYADYSASEPVLRAESRRTLAALSRHAPAGGRLLEIGSAYGFFLLEAQARFRCTGIEVAHAAALAARARGLDVIEEAADDCLPRLGPFDVAVMLDCVEHMVDPSRTLSLLHQSLAPGAVLLLTTGDWGSWPARVSGRAWRLMTPPQHLFYFTRRSLTAVLERTGYRVRECRRPWKSVPLGLAAYQVSRRMRLPLPPLGRLNSLWVPVNVLDTMRVVAVRA